MKLNLNKKFVVLSTLVCFVPCILAIVMWKDLPSQLPVHWNVAGEIDNYMPKAVAAFACPAFFAALNLVCHIAAAADKRKKNYSKTLENMTYWIIPVLANIVLALILLAGKGADVKVEIIIPVLVFILFIFIGNYLPKCKQNRTMGIKLPWTLKNEENWNRTHHVAGWLWIISGIAGLVCTFALMGQAYAFKAAAYVTIIAVAVIVPTVYSFILHKKGL